MPRKHARKRAKGASPHTPSNKGGNTQARRGALTVAERAEGRALPPPWRSESERGAEPPPKAPGITYRNAAECIARTDEAQHVTKRRAGGQIRVLWSMSIKLSTARQPLKIRALHAAKRRKRATRAHKHAQRGATSTRKARQDVKGAQDVRRGDGSPLTRYQTAAKGAKSDGGGEVDKWRGKSQKAFLRAFTAARGAHRLRGRGWSPQRKMKKYLKTIDGGGVTVI